MLSWCCTTRASARTVAFNGSGVAAAGATRRVLHEPRPQDDAAQRRACGERAGRGQRLRSAVEAPLHDAVGGPVGARDTPRRRRRRDHRIHQQPLSPTRPKSSLAIPTPPRSSCRKAARLPRASAGRRRTSRRPCAPSPTAAPTRSIAARSPRSCWLSSKRKARLRARRFRAAAGGDLHADLDGLIAA